MGFIVKQKTPQGVINLFYAVAQWDRQESTSRQKRKYLGQLSADGQEIIRSRTISSFTPEEQIALQHAGIVFRGQECNVPGRPHKTLQDNITSSTLQHTYSLEYGRMAALRFLAEENGLFAALKSSYGDVASSILAIAIYECAIGGPLSRVSDWLEETLFHHEAPLISNTALQRLITDVGQHHPARFSLFNDWISRHKNLRILVHDTTTEPSFGEQISMVTWEHNLDLQPSARINFSLAYATDTLMPLAYLRLKGDQTDIINMSNIPPQVKNSESSWSYVFDQSHFSPDTLRSLLEVGDVSMELPMSSLEARRILNQCHEALTQTPQVFVFEDISYSYIQTVYALPPKNSSESPRYINAHVYLNSEKRYLQRRKIDSILEHVQTAFKEAKFQSRQEADEWLDSNLPGHWELYVVTGNDEQHLELARSPSAYDDLINNLGISIILNSNSLENSRDTLTFNRRRNSIKKFSQILTQELSDLRLDTVTDDMADSAMIFGFIATTLYTLLENRLKEKKLLQEYSVEQVLDMLRKIRIVILPDGSKRVMPFPEKVQQILNILEIKLPQK